MQGFPLKVASAKSRLGEVWVGGGPINVLLDFGIKVFVILVGGNFVDGRFFWKHSRVFLGGLRLLTEGFGRAGNLLLRSSPCIC